MQTRPAEVLLIISMFLLSLVIFTKFEEWNITPDLPAKLSKEAQSRAMKIILDETGEPQLVESK